ncbi:E3 ubiquitin-protein ligase NRDP1 [Chamberlinius hualienensis]
MAYNQAVEMFYKNLQILQQNYEMSAMFVGFNFVITRDFISNQLLPTFKLVPEILSVRVYPYGNAQQVFDGNEWVFTCQHGEPECIGNVIQSCAVSIYPDQNVFIPYLGCTETPSNVTEPNIAASQCAYEQGLDYQLINTCAGSQEGNDLEHQMGVATESLVPEQDYVPWIIFNNVHNPTLETLATYNLLSVVCDLYTGTPPANCNAATKLSHNLLNDLRTHRYHLISINMGFEVGRFQCEVDEELLCPICSGVLEDPVQAPLCEHAFCSVCIHEWLSRQKTCPIDRQAILPIHLKAVPRILRNLLSRLQICCDNAPHGCRLVVKMDALNSHLEECEHNPKKPVPCDQGCGLIIPKDELKSHNCVHELRAMIDNQQMKLNEYQQQMAEQKLQMDEQKRELGLIKEFMNAMRASNPTIRAFANRIEQDEVVSLLHRWSSSLPRARVTRWGGMISTPDAMLQAVIKRALSESGCPSYIINELIENAHERRWPQGLSTLETRQMNRRMYENYVCKRIPGKQAVVVMACDNGHVSDDLLLEPGLVMIFAHGIE